ncbi:tRNA lysidine(34) synthetase TilS [Buchnera aphidicola]|uniref:tRNA lysidine(34) synthetase TilS n=1 Tax=Buchnera aphidicola TaxID=9 RepID=UPI003463B8A7
MINKFIKKIKKNQRILISYSGGLDSTVLLYQLIPFTKKYPFLKIRAIHINHNIEKNALLWSQHCKKICKKNQIELVIKKNKLKIKNNVQETARNIRYKIIKKHMIKGEILLTSHHLNDQCETLFLALKRGSGPSGLSGIPEIQSLGHDKYIIRPLLKKSKNELLEWALLNKIQWIDDDSNLIDKYDRNFIRNNIINLIEKRWNFFIKNCVKSMKLCDNQTIALNYFLDEILLKIKTIDNAIPIETFHNYPKVVQKSLIRRWIFLYTKNVISYIQTQEIYYKIIQNKKNTKYIITIKKYEIRRYKNYIFQIKKFKSLKNTIIFWHNTKKPLKLINKLGYIIPEKKGIQVPYPKNSDLVSIRFTINKKTLLNDSKIKNMKNIWQKNKIPPWYRNQIPALFYNDQLIAIMGVLIIPHFKKKNHDVNKWNISWIDIFNDSNHYLNH